MRIAKACKECRAAKRRCTPVIVDESQHCRQCLQRKEKCSLATRPLNGELKSIAPDASISSIGAITVDMPTREHLVDLYLQLIHDGPHTLFHPATLRAQVRENTLPEAILYSIMSLAARFSQDPSIRRRTEEFFVCAKESFKKELFNINLENIQAGVLVGNLCGVEGEPELESLFFGISFRLAQIIRLPKSSLDDGAVSREIKIRTWWTLNMIDRWSSAGLAVPQQLTDDDSYPMPMPEIDFWHLESNERPKKTAGGHQYGIWGYMVILVKVFGRIQDLHKRLADGALSDVEAEQMTRNLASELEKFLNILPLNLHFSLENLKIHASQGLGRAFVALHLGYHHYATLLYFPYLDHQVKDSPSKANYSNRCKNHAFQFSDTLRLSHQTKDCEVVYFIVAHMTVVSSAALLHNLLFGEHQELPDTRIRLYNNFAIVLKLKEFWPAVDMMIERLFIFQKACMCSMEKIYTVDKWVVKFLLQHALPIEESSSMLSEISERSKVANDTLLMLRNPNSITR